MIGIYRVETEERRGPYWAALRRWESGGLQYGEVENRPEWYEDLPLNKPVVEDGWSFGFISIAQFYSWFNDAGEIQELKALGFKLSKYNVTPENMYIADHQVVFDRANSELTQRFELDAWSLKEIATA